MQVYKLLERIVQIPLHQYARYFQKYSQILPHFAPSELVSEQEYEQIEESVRQESEQELSEQEFQQQVQKKIYETKSKLYTATQDMVSKRWTFESVIKRTYFHVKPLDDAQRQNWKKYLDFEEQEGDVARIYALYERCLVPCASYESFWERYALYLQNLGDYDRAYNAYARATTLFVHPSRSSIRFHFALFLEEQQRYDEARAVYEQFLETNPGHVEMMTNQVYFEARQQNEPKIKEIFSNALETLSDENAQGFIRALQIKMDPVVFFFKFISSI
jgi:pre-mRNA-processing factor 39